MQHKFKILVSCYACSPFTGSEPGMGWNFISELSKFHDLHVIVEKEKWEADIIKKLSTEETFNKNLNFYFIKKKRNRFLRKIWPPSYYWYYRRWQKNALKLANDLQKEHHFDIIHQLNMVGFREPGYLWKLQIPFVWGPIGGMEGTPWSMLLSMNWHGIIYYSLRNIINYLQIRLLKRPRLAATRENNALIAATPHNANLIEKLWNKKPTIITEVGILTGNQNLEIAKYRDIKESLRIVWSGQHISGKSLNLLLKALGKLGGNVNFHLEVLGIGAQTKNWQQLGKRLNINGYINWNGWKNKDEALKIMESCHVLVITSLKDLTATVTLEALSLGLPIICLDHCGFSYVVDQTCGIKIPVKSPNQVVNDLASALKLLALNENLRFSLSKGALIRAKDFAWDKKVERLNSIYESLVSDGSINKWFQPDR